LAVRATLDFVLNPLLRELVVEGGILAVQLAVADRECPVRREILRLIKFGADLLRAQDRRSEQDHQERHRTDLRHKHLRRRAECIKIDEREKRQP
jgi:hypothetical protein